MQANVKKEIRKSISKTKLKKTKVLLGKHEGIIMCKTENQREKRMRKRWKWTENNRIKSMADIFNKYFVSVTSKLFYQYPSVSEDCRGHKTV